MNHHASKNWGNTRDKEKGIQVAPHVPNHNAVKLLLASPEADALKFVARHAGNTAWLEMAKEIESAKRKPCKAVLTAIDEALAPPAPKPLPRSLPLDLKACKDA